MSSQFGKLLARIRKWIVTPTSPLDSRVRYPPNKKFYLAGSIGLILLEWWYFYAQVPYDMIPNKPAFWLSFVAWASPPVIISWVYRNAPSKRELEATAKMFMTIGLAVIILSILGRRFDTIIPIVASFVPGGIAGGLIGSDGTLISRLYKEHRKKNAKMPVLKTGNEEYTDGNSRLDDYQGMPSSDNQIDQLLVTKDDRVIVRITRLTSVLVSLRVPRPDCTIMRLDGTILH